MKLDGFIGPAYLLDSVNVDAQRCVNLYPETIESGKGKGGQVAYLRSTPGLEQIAEIGNGPIRCVHVDSIGRVFVVSGNQVFALSRKEDWRYLFVPATPAPKTFPNTDVNITTNAIAIVSHGFATGLRIRLSSPATFPSPLTAGVDYYVIRVDGNTLKLATSFANALAGTAIDITNAGGDTITVTPQSYATLKNIKHTDINFANNSFVKTAHGFPNGIGATLKSNGQVASPLADGTTYFITNRTDETFQLATSFANALAGTAIDLVDIDDAWNVKLLGSSGEYTLPTDDPVILSASSGPVKAASMSLGGDGSDSSTIFVDGSSNFLLKDDGGFQTFGLPAAAEGAQAVINITNDVTVQSAEDVDAFVSGYTFSMFAFQNASIGDAGYDIIINFYKSVNNTTGATGINVQVSLDDGQSITTAQVVQFLNYGVVPGKNITYNLYAPLAGYTLTSLDIGSLSFSGGGSESFIVEIPTGTSISTTFSRVTLDDLGYGSVPTATQVVWSDGYFILNQFGTNKFWVSDLQGFNVDALSFASSEGNPDILLALTINNRYLYAFNEKTTEVYANTGNADFPFERIQGGLMEIGLAAEYSVAKIGGVVCWLGRTAEGQGVVFAAEGMSPRRISTHAIEHAIRGYADISTAKGFAYQEGGHLFYVLNFDEATWVYDFSTGMWHERAFTNEGVLERHRAEYYAYDIKRDQHLVSDYATNQLFQLKEGHYTDDGNAITRLRASPHGSAGLNWVFYTRFQLDMETGIGLDGGVQGSNPTVMLDWSDDGGHTWASESWALADAGSGQIGDYKKRVVWRRLGKSRDRVWRVKVTDPVKVVLIDAYVDAQAGAS